MKYIEIQQTPQEVLNEKKNKKKERKKYKSLG